ncbi:MAG TPA: hypothetical protein VNT42_12835 [Sphingomonas sp.]|nr:hypothetical protein [Sphingomonas sp.]
MDLVDLYHLRGVAIVRSKLGATAAARRGYGQLARRYAEQIESFRTRRPIDAAELTPAL